MTTPLLTSGDDEMFGVMPCNPSSSPGVIAVLVVVIAVLVISAVIIIIGAVIVIAASLRLAAQQTGSVFSSPPDAPAARPPPNRARGSATRHRRP